LVLKRLGSAYARVRMEATTHRIVMQSIVVGEKRHPLVMHHVTTNHDPSRAAGFGPSGVVDRLVVTVVTEKRRVAQPSESPQVFRGGGGFHAQSERCRIRSDDELLFLPAPQRQRRHAERAILIDVVPVKRTECGLRDAPW